MSLSTISFWDGSKVCGTKNCNKTTGAYSGIPGDDMDETRLKGKRNACAAQIGRQPHAAAMGVHVPRAPVVTGYV
ncbi:prephenate dehydrogenase [Paraburkholderia caffeinilytica]|uniref:prephenate dehydrogenase n=1 Tax=Paraburkholderia caffeinilytica TaxID=1761016 RepID=UPI0013BE9894|nr:prephenate dehydrogenase [Paraburkholderia caffeinilytica]